STPRARPVSASHRRTQPSSPALATSRPSGLKATPLTPPPAPPKWRSPWPPSTATSSGGRPSKRFSSAMSAALSRSSTDRGGGAGGGGRGGGGGGGGGGAGTGGAGHAATPAPAPRAVTTARTAQAHGRRRRPRAGGAGGGGGSAVSPAAGLADDVSAAAGPAGT